MYRVILTLSAALWAPLALAVELSAPARAPIDTDVRVQIIGATDPKSFVSMVAPDAPEGEYGRYAYARSATVTVTAAAEVGVYEVRLLAADRPYATLASTQIELFRPEVTMTAPDQVPIGTDFAIQWQGPSSSREYITLVSADTPDGEYAKYAYTRGEGSGSVKLTSPVEPGSYELRYMSGSQKVVLGRRALSIGDVQGSVEFAPNIGIGAKLSVEWKGTGNPRDFLVIVPPDAEPGSYDSYVYATKTPVTLVAPEAPGRYEVRLLTAKGDRILARGVLTVGAASATVEASREVENDTEFAVRWTGPDNDLDYVAVTEVGKPTSYISYSYTRRGSPLAIRAPKQPGDYELHYLTGRSDISLANQPLKVVLGSKPGSLLVRASEQTTGGSAAGGASGAAIELILDASGSMLQRIGGERRIELARNALDQLINRSIAPSTPVALRVFGHLKPNACDTDLVQALAPLNRASLSATVRGIEAKNLAKTPIAASLAAVAEDLAGVEGEAVVILVTDGEETCDGDPAAEITKLRQQGFDVVLNIVGFAIDEYALEQEFARWAELGGGAYFSASDGAALASSVQQAVRQPFGVYRDGKRVASGVIGGDALSLKPGSYELRSGGASRSIEVRSGEETLVRW